MTYIYNIIINNSLYSQFLIFLDKINNFKQMIIIKQNYGFIFKYNMHILHSRFYFLENNL